MSRLSDLLSFKRSMVAYVNLFHLFRQIHRHITKRNLPEIVQSPLRQGKPEVTELDETLCELHSSTFFLAGSVY